MKLHTPHVGGILHLPKLSESTSQAARKIKTGKEITCRRGGRVTEQHPDLLSLAEKKCVLFLLFCGVYGMRVGRSANYTGKCKKLTVKFCSR